MRNDLLLVSRNKLQSVSINIARRGVVQLISIILSGSRPKAFTVLPPGFFIVLVYYACAVRANDMLLFMSTGSLIIAGPRRAATHACDYYTCPATATIMLL